MKQVNRWIIAVPMAIVFLGLAAAVYPLGFFLGGMLTDSCSHLPGIALYYLQIIWPAMMLLSALTPSLFVLKRARGRWVILVAVIGSVLSSMCYLLWLPILSVIC